MAKKNKSDYVKVTNTIHNPSKKKYEEHSYKMERSFAENLLASSPDYSEATISDWTDEDEKELLEAHAEANGEEYVEDPEVQAINQKDLEETLKMVQENIRLVEEAEEAKNREAESKKKEDDATKQNKSLKEQLAEANKKLKELEKASSVKEATTDQATSAAQPSDSKGADPQSTTQK